MKGANVSFADVGCRKEKEKSESCDRRKERSEFDVCRRAVSMKCGECNLIEAEGEKGRGEGDERDGWRVMKG